MYIQGTVIIFYCIEIADWDLSQRVSCFNKEKIS